MAKYSPDQAGQKVASFLRTVIDRAGFKIQFEVASGEGLYPDFENPDLLVRFSGPDVDLLLENKAELLLALEQLTLEVLRMPTEDHSLLCFDAHDYRVLRVAELRLSATTAAERVKESGRPFHFSPMTSRERRIIHLALRDDKAVRSESLGLGPQRGVVIYPADMPSLPEPPPRPEFRRGSGGPPSGGRPPGGRPGGRGGDRGRGGPRRG